MRFDGAYTGGSKGRRLKGYERTLPKLVTQCLSLPSSQGSRSAACDESSCGGCARSVEHPEKSRLTVPATPFVTESIKSPSSSPVAVQN